MCWDFDETCHKHLASRWELLKGFSNKRSKVRVVCVNDSSGERSRSYVWMLQQWWKVRVVCVNATVVKGQGRMCECYSGERSGPYVWMLQRWKVRVVCVNATVVKGQGRMCECYSSGERSRSYVWMLQQWWKVRVVCVNATAVVKGQVVCVNATVVKGQGRMCECYRGQRSGSYISMALCWGSLVVWTFQL